jgi:predicted nucleotidyltransferase
MTRFGPLDLLGTIGKGDDYARLLDEASEVEIGEGLKVRVLSLQGLVRTKEETGQEKDKAVLPLLRRVLEEKSRR